MLHQRRAPKLKTSFAIVFAFLVFEASRIPASTIDTLPVFSARKTDQTIGAASGVAQDLIPTPAEPTEHLALLRAAGSDLSKSDALFCCSKFYASAWIEPQSGSWLRGLQNLFAVFGHMAAGGTLVQWVAWHRQHHENSDAAPVILSGELKLFSIIHEPTNPACANGRRRLGPIFHWLMPHSRPTGNQPETAPSACAATRAIG